jgi:hypothetical protein
MPLTKEERKEMRRREQRYYQVRATANKYFRDVVMNYRSLMDYWCRPQMTLDMWVDNHEKDLLVFHKKISELLHDNKLDDAKMIHEWIGMIECDFRNFKIPHIPQNTKSVRSTSQYKGFRRHKENAVAKKRGIESFDKQQKLREQMIEMFSNAHIHPL